MLDIEAARRAASSFGWTSAIMIGLMAFVMGLVASAPARSAESPSRDIAILQVALAAPAPIAQSVMPDRGRLLVVPVVGRACRQCRRSCYHDFRKHCWEAWCRQEFTLCMRNCWYEYCR